MEIAQYQGRSLIPSRVIRFVTRSIYSHSAFLFDGKTEQAAINFIKGDGHFKSMMHISAGSVVEAWDTGLRNTPEISVGHKGGTTIDIFSFKDPLTQTEELDLLQWLDGELGSPYDWLNVFRFVTRRHGDLNRDWFCSENVFAGSAIVGKLLLERTESWEVPPNWIPRSPLLRYSRTVTV